MFGEVKYRLGGLLALVVGAAVGWSAIWQPLQQADLSADTVTWMPRVVVLLAVCAVFGLYLLFTGNRYPYRDVERSTLTTAGWILFAIIAVAAVTGFFWMDMTLKSLGYH
jgi:flagellar biosynthesis protein FliQ